MPDWYALDQPEGHAHVFPIATGADPGIGRSAPSRWRSWPRNWKPVAPAINRRETAMTATARERMVLAAPIHQVGVKRRNSQTIRDLRLPQEGRHYFVSE